MNQLIIPEGAHPQNRTNVSELAEAIGLTVLPGIARAMDVASKAVGGGSPDTTAELFGFYVVPMVLSGVGLTRLVKMYSKRITLGYEEARRRAAQEQVAWTPVSTTATAEEIVLPSHSGSLRDPVGPADEQDFIIRTLQWSDDEVCHDAQTLPLPGPDNSLPVKPEGFRPTAFGQQA